MKNPVDLDVMYQELCNLWKRRAATNNTRGDGMQLLLDSVNMNTDFLNSVVSNCLVSIAYDMRRLVEALDPHD